jgi:hypothetical protein
MSSPSTTPASLTYTQRGMVVVKSEGGVRSFVMDDSPEVWSIDEQMFERRFVIGYDDLPEPYTSLPDMIWNSLSRIGRVIIWRCLNKGLEDDLLKHIRTLKPLSMEIGLIDWFFELMGEKKDGARFEVWR